MAYLYSALAWLIGALALVAGGVTIVFLASLIGIDGVFSLTDGVGDLTCWHCHRQTKAGVKQCTHCRNELQ